MYGLECLTVDVITREWFWYLFPEMRCYDGNISQNNTQVSAEMKLYNNKANPKDMIAATGLETLPLLELNQRFFIASNLKI